ncbi:hypothetical protein JVU11DRAFT_5386 [Chiua virens]|nr:hypothetical protein JVU11DRAFT_5386 [Chiua virens]
MAEPEDEDDFPNDFDGLDFDHIPELQASTINRDTPEVPVSSVARNATPPPAASPAPSVRSSSVEPMDPDFLAAIDVLEARVLGETNQDDTLKTASDSLQGEGTSSLNQAGEDSIRPSNSSCTRKGKRKAESQDSIGRTDILAGYETELTCPVCCDLFVGAQVANPCGHTICGECGHQWLGQNIYEPTCAVCRSNLSVRKPLIPCYTTDNLVQQHLRALKISGRPEWQEGGYKTIEWCKRQESWKKEVVARAEKEKLNDSSRLRRFRRHLYDHDFEEYQHIVQLGPADDSGEDELVPRPIPRRRTRSRR